MELLNKHHQKLSEVAYMSNTPVSEIAKVATNSLVHFEYVISENIREDGSDRTFIPLNAGGFVVESGQNQKQVISCFHVIQETRTNGRLKAAHPDGQLKAKLPGVLGKVINLGSAKDDVVNDLASYPIVDNVDFQPVQLGESKEVQAGQTVYAVSYLHTEIPVIIPGHIAAVFYKGKFRNEIEDFGDSSKRLLFTGTTVPGMSGGMLLNEKGLVIGIISQSQTQQVLAIQRTLSGDNLISSTPWRTPSGMGIAIPIEYLKELL